MNDFQRIEKAVSFISKNFYEQPSLKEVAQHVFLSPHHFQRMFKSWAGISPKKFLQFITLEHAKKLLNQNENVYTTAYESGLSGSGRLHDLFVSIQAMTPGEYKNGGENLKINCSSHNSIFGRIAIGSTEIGICYLQFTDEDPTEQIKNQFTNASINEKSTSLHKDVLDYVNGIRAKKKLNLHIKGTSFQVKVWEALLNIEQGDLVNYGMVSQMINKKDAHRAVGTAIGKNPIAYIIPCHRVIKSTGHLGGYRWGTDKKQCIIAWESAQMAQGYN